jgi:putative ABC transport system substrate-binding protein
MNGSTRERAGQRDRLDLVAAPAHHPAMDRRRFLLISLAGAVASPLAAGAQQAKTIRIGWLHSGSTVTHGAHLDAFRQRLRELGYIEGRNIALESRWAEGRFDRLPDLATELVRLKVDIVAAGPTPAAVAAKNATEMIPIVMISAGNPVELGLIASLAHPGGNVTGLSYSVGMETIGKGLELLKGTVPGVRRVAVLSNPGNPSHAFAISSMKIAARSLGVQLELLEARGPNDFDGAFAAMAKRPLGRST